MRLGGLPMFDRIGKRLPTFRHGANLMLGAAALGGCYAISRYNYLLFHSLVEISAAFVACAVFMLFWNARRFLDNGFFLFIGIACLFAGIFDLLHVLTYRGMSVFPGLGGDESLQLKTAGRWIASLSFLVSPLFFRRRLNVALTLAAYGGVFVLVIYCVVWHQFPDCYDPETGMTRFEQIGRTFSCVVFLAAAGPLAGRRRELDRHVFRLLLASLMVSSASEFASAVSIEFIGPLKVAAHLLEVVSLYLIYRAFVEVSLTKPYDLVFRNLKRSETALRSQRRFLETVLDTVQTGIVACDAQGTLTLFNRAAREFHGLPQEPLPADQWAEHYDLYQTDGKTRMRTEDVPLVRALRGEEVRDTVFMIVPKNRPAHVVLSDGRPLIDENGRRAGAVVATRDITERQRIVQTLHTSQTKYKTLYESSGDAIILATPEGRFLSGNRAAIAMFGCKDEQELTSRTPLDFSPERQPAGFASAATIQQMMSIAMLRGSHFFGWVHKRLDGREFPATILLTRMEIEGKPLVQGIVRDVTEQKRMEEERDLTSQRMESLLALDAHDRSAR